MIDALPLLLGPEGYNISRSVRLRSSASASFSRTPGSSGNRKTWTWSGWVKRGTLGVVSRIFAADDGSASTDQDYNTLLFNSSNQLQFSGNLTDFRVTTAVYRDASAWYHIVFAVDTTQATAANRFKLYVNGAEVTAFGTSNNPSQNTDLAVNAAIGHYIGSIAGASYVDAYLTEINFIDGQALTPSSFGETDSITGVWKPKKYAGTYGTNGFFLNFSDNSNNTAATIGKDYSGNGNNWTPNNISVTSGSTYDSMLDVPTQWADGGNGRGNYCVMNPLEHRSNRITPTDGNITVTLGTGSNAFFGSRSTMGVATGKWYWEVNVVARDSGAGSWVGIGIVLGNVNWPAGNGLGANSGGYEYLNDGFKWGAGSASAYGATYNNGDVIGVALDADAQTLTFYKNGVSQGTAFSSIGSGESWFPTAEIYRSTGTTQTLAMNFGQRPFAYTPPSGFKALNTLNLPAPTISNGASYFATTLWTGDGATSRTISTAVNGVSFQPDLVWVKARNNAREHILEDSVRGLSYDKQLSSNTTGAEASNPGAGGVTGADATTITLGGTGTMDNVNRSTWTYVGWQWKEGATQGFDIVTYTGNGTNNRAISHSLGVTPAFIIVKDRTNTFNWDIYHQSLGINATLIFTTAATRNVSAFGTSAPTSTVFYTQNSYTNTNSANLVAYLFSEVAGFSRFGSYTGNGSSDGPFVFCGFRPRWVMIKASSFTENWAIVDTARDTVNASGLVLTPNLSDAELDWRTSFPLDITSNGFKVRSTGTRTNQSGSTYIFAAFAEVPFKAALAR